MQAPRPRLAADPTRASDARSRPRGLNTSRELRFVTSAVKDVLAALTLAALLVVSVSAARADDGRPSSVLYAGSPSTGGAPPPGVASAPPAFGQPAPYATTDLPVSPVTLQEEPRPPALALTINPLALLFGQARVELEFRLDRRGSGYVEVFYQPAGLLLGPNANAFGLTAGGRLYFSGEPVEGFWGGLDASVFGAWVGDVSAVGHGYALTLGNTWLFGGSLALSVGGGARVEFYEFGSSSGVEVSGVALRPVLRLSIGFAFG
jgi:hypothetical protein